jgi:ABC-2 type transport system permease protein
MIDQLKRACAIAKKDIRIYYLKGPVVIFGILFPVFLFMASPDC